MWNRRSYSISSRRGSLLAQLPITGTCMTGEVPSDEEEMTGEGLESQDNSSDPECQLDPSPNIDGEEEDLTCPRLLPEGDAEKPVVGGAKKRRASKDERYVKTKNKRKRQRDLYKGYIKLCLSGVSLIALGYTIYLVNPLVIAKHIALTMREGSFISSMWQVPPLRVFFKVYLFNVTNSERFIQGLDKKIRVEEIGPYVYSETLVNSNVTWNSNMSVSFTPTRDVRFEREMSVGDPEVDSIISLNVPLLGIASMLHKSSAALNFALSTVVTYLKPEPFRDLTVKECLWGYEDPLVGFASKVLPSWINFEKFGLLDRMLDEGENRVTISTGESDKSTTFTVETFNGSPRLTQWPNENNKSRCAKVEGTIEGLLLPQNIRPDMNITVYRKAFCRPLPLAFINSSLSEDGYPIFIYTVAHDALDPANPENSCYCKPDCLPKGLSDMSPCYYNIPVAMSFPHFYDADKSVQEGVDGLQPDQEKHASLVAIQPDTGVPIYMKSRIQMNLVVKKTRFISRVKRFNELIIPVMWIQVELEALPLFVTRLIGLLLVSGPVIQTSLIIGFVVLGFILLFFANLRYVWNSGLFRDRHSATLLSIRLKKQQEERIIWAGQYTQLIPIPLNTISRNR